MTSERYSSLFQVRHLEVCGIWSELLTGKTNRVKARTARTRLDWTSHQLEYRDYSERDMSAPLKFTCIMCDYE